MATFADLRTQAEAFLDASRAAGLKVTTAESCTGGLIGACLTEIAGSSDVFERGFITYSNEAKIELIDVPADLIERVGAVSEEVARAMAEGALVRSSADMAVAVTGVAGPGGGTATKPVGLVHIACAVRDGISRHAACHFDGDREAVRRQTVAMALTMLDALVPRPDPDL